jgi:WD40 repeat protein
MSNQIKISRYPGTRPFEPSEQGLFYGREREINDLTRMTILERLVVLFGKSGYGKSSLLQAGVLPKLALQEEVWSPLSIRLGVYNGQFSPCKIVVEQLKKFENAENTEGSFLDEGTLWKSFKKRQSPEKARVLLIFDQFEEFFTYPLEQQKEFKSELAELIYSSMPQAIVEEFKAAPLEQKRFLARAMNIHVLISIRSDKLSLLHSMKDALPAILHSRYELQGLNIEQARQAIEAPAIADNAARKFTAPPYTFEKEAIDFMVNKLSERSSELLMEPQIEAFQLQIVCQEIEDKVIATNKTVITKADLPSFEAVYEDYYKTQIEKISDPVFKKVARIILEEKLISGNLDNNSARREPMSGSKLIEEAAATQELLDNLVNFRLLRREPNSLGGDSYEISHDTLISPVLKSKNIRLTAEREEENKLKTALEKKKAIKEGLLIIAGLLVAFTAFYFISNYLKNKEKNVEIAHSLINANAYYALQMSYSAYDDDKTPLTSTILSLGFYNYLKQHNGFIFEEIEMDDPIESATFSANSNQLIVHLNVGRLNKDTTVIYDLTSRKIVPFSNQKGMNTASSEDSLSLFDGQLSAKMLTDSVIDIEDYRGKYSEKHQFQTEYTHNISFSPKGDKIMTVHTWERKVRIWHLAQKNMFILRGPNYDLKSAVFAPDSSNFVLTVGSDSNAYLWSNRGQNVQILKGLNAELNDAIFSKNGKYILLAAKDNSISVINSNDFKLINSVNLSEKPLSIIEGNSNSLLINLHEEDSELFEFNKEQLNRIKSFNGLRNATFTPDNQSVIGIYQDSLIVIYDLKTDKKEFIKPNKGLLNNAVYSVNKKQLLMTTIKGDVFIFENNRASIKLNKRDVNHAIFSNNGQFIGTATSDALFIWNTKGEQIAEWHYKTGFNQISFSADNKYFSGTTIDGRVYVLPMPETIYNWLKTNQFPMTND